jgi:hypothetical protein
MIDEHPARPTATAAILLSVVSVEPERRVQCQQPGCGRGVHAAVHVVREAGRLMVLGSTCFQSRYGGPGALGPSRFDAGGGRALTQEERDLLVANAEALIEAFEAELAKKAEAEASTNQGDTNLVRPDLRADLGRDDRARHPGSGPPARSRARPSPWPWQRPNTSVALIEGPAGTWVRVEHGDGCQRLVPWPRFEGWELALPPEVGSPDDITQAIKTLNIVSALQVLRGLGFRVTAMTWQELVRIPAR